MGNNAPTMICCDAGKNLVIAWTRGEMHAYNIRSQEKEDEDRKNGKSAILLISAAAAQNSNARSFLREGEVRTRSRNLSVIGGVRKTIVKSSFVIHLVYFQILSIP